MNNDNDYINITERDEENKNFISSKHESPNLILDNKSEFTFKQNPNSNNNNHLKSSIANNKYINEEEKLDESEIEENPENIKRDPLIHDYPLEITNSIEDLI